MTSEIKNKEQIFASQSRLMFGQVREDAAVDEYLLGLTGSTENSGAGKIKRVFVIASGGCTALTLLSAEPSIPVEVEALDISEAQIALVELKMTILKRLGFPAFCTAAQSDATTYYAQVKADLSPRSQRILEKQKRQFFRNGLNNAGWVDQRMAQLTGLFYLFVHSKDYTKKFLLLKDVAKQKEFYYSNWRNWQWKLTMRAAFSKAFLYLAHGRAAAYLVPDNFTQVMEVRLDKALTAFPNATNPYIWQAFFARYSGDSNGLPPYLQSGRSESLQTNISNLHLHCEDTIKYFAKQKDESFDYIGLSNILELLPPSYANALQKELVRCLRPDGLICVRAIFPRNAQTFDSDTQGCLVLDKSLSEKAEARDRSLFCNFYEVYRRLV